MKVTSDIPKEYVHLFETTSQPLETKNVDIEQLLIEILSKSTDLHYMRRVSQLALKEKALNSLERVSNDKAENTRYTNPYIDGAVVICHAANAFLGGNNGAVNLFTHSLDMTNKNVQKANDSKGQILSFDERHVDRFLKDVGDNVQSAKNQQEKDTNAIDSMMERTQRMFEKIAS